MYFLIYGAGALGQALGCMLAVDGHQVDLVLRQRFIDLLQGKELQVSGIFGKYAVPSSQLGLLEAVPQEPGSYDFILITTKAYDTATALQAIETLGEVECPVVSMQNGCGNIEQIALHFGAERTMGARVITGFEIVSPGEVKITVTADDVHVGSYSPGEISPEATLLAQVINRAGLPCIAVDDVHRDLFAKLLYNCALNPLGAILGVPYGLLGESDHARTIMDRVIEETFAVIEALGGETPWKNVAEYREFFYGTLIPSTYNHRPSMLQDLEQNKPTEVEALVGYVARKGRETKVLTPTCDVLAELVRFKEGR